MSFCSASWDLDCQDWTGQRRKQKENQTAAILCILSWASVSPTPPQNVKVGSAQSSLRAAEFPSLSQMQIPAHPAPVPGVGPAWGGGEDPRGSGSGGGGSDRDGPRRVVTAAPAPLPALTDFLLQGEADNPVWGWANIQEGREGPRSNREGKCEVGKSGSKWLLWSARRRLLQRAWLWHRI